MVPNLLRAIIDFMLYDVPQRYLYVLTVPLGTRRKMFLSKFMSLAILPDGSYVVDVGAHIGIYTLKVAREVGNKGLVIAIEPDPQNYKMLCRNVRINRYTNVIPLNVALAEHSGRKTLYRSPYSAWHSTTFPHGKSLEVSAKTLDDICKELGLKHLDLIIIDAEGAELDILKGAQIILKGQGMRIIIAAYHTPTEAKTLMDFLLSKGFKAKVLNSSAGKLVEAASNTSRKQKETKDGNENSFAGYNFLMST